MAEYIEREQVIKVITDHGVKVITEGREMDPVDDTVDIAYAIQALSAADVAEVEHAKWKRKRNEMTCSRCEFIYYDNKDSFTYCPNCGARMDKK